MMNRFITGTYKCENCGKLTRATLGRTDRHCPKCIDLFQHENAHSDNGLTSENCGWGDWHKGEPCPLNTNNPHECGCGKRFPDRKDLVVHKENDHY